MNKVKVGIVGLGAIAQRMHLPVLATLKNVKLEAVAEINRRRASKIAKKWNISEIYDDYDKMYENSKIQAVFVCLPNFLHYEAVYKALNHDLHVFCEKPMGTNSQEGFKLVSEARRRKLFLAVGYNRRLNKNYKKAAQIIKSMKLGRITTIHGALVNLGPYAEWMPRSDWFFDKKSGGVLMDSGSHLFDLITYILSDRPVTVHAQASNIYDLDVYDNVGGTFRTDNGTIGTFNVAWAVANKSDALQVNGTAGSLHVDSLVTQEVYGRSDPLDKLVSHTRHALEILSLATRTLRRGKLPSETYFEEDQSFIDCILQEHKRPCVTGEEALRILEILEATELSIEKGGPIIIRYREIQ